MGSGIALWRAHSRTINDQVLCGRKAVALSDEDRHKALINENAI